MGAAGAGKLATSLISSAAQGAKGGSSGGGISPQQAALAQYSAGQQELASNTAFANQGLGASTMGSYADAGANMGAAMAAAGMSDANAAAQNQVNQAQLQQLASSAGFGAGFGTPASGGSFGASPTTGSS